MRKNKLFSYLVVLIGTAALATSCTTRPVYDAHGRLIGYEETVDAGTAIALGAAAAGVAYAVGHNQGQHSGHHKHSGHHSGHSGKKPPKPPRRR